MRVQHEQGDLDEVAIEDPTSVVIERMGDDAFQVRIRRANGDVVHVELYMTDDRPLDQPQPFLVGRVDVNP